MVTSNIWTTGGKSNKISMQKTCEAYNFTPCKRSVDETQERKKERERKKQRKTIAFLHLNNFNPGQQVDLGAKSVERESDFQLASLIFSWVSFSVVGPPTPPVWAEDKNKRLNPDWDGQLQRKGKKRRRKKKKACICSLSLHYVQRATRLCHAVTSFSWVNLIKPISAWHCLAQTGLQLWNKGWLQCRGNSLFSLSLSFLLTKKKKKHNQNIAVK